TFMARKKVKTVVLSISKIQFKSNSQHRSWYGRVLVGCAQYFKDTIQKQFTTDLDHVAIIALLCSVFQRYNSKAIHNVKCLKSLFQSFELWKRDFHRISAF
ncbi:MAG: hypothetical protein KKD74_09775, partial [Bacteroidetes bacterium]|nr:hypothetical protein [Bacteroidota bacterium]